MGVLVGAAISQKRIVEEMDGEIGVDSEEEWGSTFWFTARFASASRTLKLSERKLRDADNEVVHQFNPRQDRSRNFRKILLVEDNDANSKVSRGSNQ